LAWGEQILNLFSLISRSDDDAATIASLQKQIRKLELLLEETREDIETEKKQKLGLQTKVRQLEQELTGKLIRK
jgi:predicted  nucleic acid-binding Zn-ribbon protein